MSRTALRLAASILVLSLAIPAYATPEDEERNAAPQEVIVTGSMRARQGGAQDVNHFRGRAEFEVPMPDTLTPEGLMGDYDLQIPGPACAQLFCLTGEAVRADLMARPRDKVFVGLGFNTSLDAARWRRAPLNLVAVVDKSGSMSGQPLELVRLSLLQILSQLTPKDQLSIVLYGDRSHRHLEPTRVTEANREAIAEAIRAIASSGSTNMEEGLRVGYDTAFESQQRFKGVTRLMLFTDEQPNVGATDAESFMGMAREASARRVGLTTVGVGVQFDAPLATEVASVRGGNLYFMRDRADVAKVFKAKLDTMVSELAHDLEVQLRPQAGYKISAVYGVPGEQLEWSQEGAIRLVVPTAFLSTEGGGLFVTLERANPNLPEPAPQDAVLDVGLAYVSALDGRTGGGALKVAGATRDPSEGLRLGHALVDEYLGLRLATTAFHAGDEDAAYKTLRELDIRLARVPDRKLAPERKMVGALLARTAYLAGYTGEAPAPTGPMAMLGNWEVTGTLGEPGLKRGDRLQLKDDNEAVIAPKGTSATRDGYYEMRGRKLVLESDEKEQAFAYQIRGDRMTLVLPEDGSTVRLKRLPLERPGG